MKKVMWMSWMIVSTSMASAAAENFGKMTLQDSAAKGLKEILDGYQESQSSDLLVKGTVKKVCEEKGCWLTLEDQGQEVRVFFKNYSFLVTSKLVGKKVLAEGSLRKKVRSVAELKHLAQDAGENKKTIEAIKHDKTSFEFEATGLKSL